MQFITSDVVVGMELVHNDCIAEWRKYIGPTNTAIAKKDSPDSIRAIFGTD